MRRLPVYFLIDVSESMVGDPISQVESGMAQLIQELKKDPNALETVHISVLVFAGDAKTLVPLNDIISFYPPKFPIGSGTSLSKGLGHLMSELRANIVRTTAEKKGDWKPIVFLFTDGVPTDDTIPAIKEWQSNWSNTANLIAISLGDATDLELLNKLTKNVMQLANTGADGYREFFKWVTDSIKTSSESTDSNGSKFELSERDNNCLAKIDVTNKVTDPLTVDDNYVVILGTCQNTKNYYLIKYQRARQSSGLEGLNLSTRIFKLKGAYQIDKIAYSNLSDGSIIAHKINSEELQGVPTCPCCGNQVAFAVCECEQVHCIVGDGVSTCPSCGITGKYGSGQGGFDVNRMLG